MAPFTLETAIVRPADQVFAYLRDYANQREWQGPNVLEVVVEPPGPARIGTRVHKARRTPMGTQRFTEEVVELDEAARRWTERTISGGLTGTEITWHVIDDAPGAKLRFSAELRGKGTTRLLLPLIRRAAAKDWVAEQQRLKRELEGRPGTS